MKPELTNRLNVLVIGPAEQERGGIAQYISEQIRHSPDKLSISGFDVSAPKKEGLAVFPAALFKILVDIFKFLRLEKPDIVHVHVAQGISFYRESLFGLIASWYWNSDIVLHVHGSSFDKFLESSNWVLKIYILKILSWSDCIVCLSKYWKSILEEEVDHDRIVVLHNAVEPNDYDPTFKRKDDLTISFVSDLVPRKGVAEFLEAIQRLETDENLKVEIAGKGPLSEDVEQVSDDSKVTYHGFISESEKHDLLSNSDIFVLPSYAEGLPIVILEAMAGGNMIISTNVGSIPDVFDEQNGRFVPPKDADAIKKAIEDVSSNKEEAESIARDNRVMIEDKYSWDAHMDKLLEIYASLAQ
ncbi:putative glycosyltransferase, type 1 [Haladaptatus paucihalophilus DX253]|uniref:Glycosyltransferase involved in cell wall bisynthesis n=1 Tax=Haladaptatus paucihalophilus DX253 TaxID=797209 RepID=E7QZJ5_HALPU|nr:glycosyltransferase family 4 protein [Haladaptatus paucihalophilus]EFW90116.1 putative glycosyltransferase, type 1 [Haladaptatus paucihalophilus DX253]SHL05978.1 Glycosyltransferase involved in cell wall bisynthesis [Haladaptatus paucihalophilus DX253]